MDQKKIFLFVIILFMSSQTYAQQDVIKKDQYQIGPDERLLITVHIFGEVRIPGEYLVPDNTDILELISTAGGPTAFSNLNNVKITRGLSLMNSIGKSSDYRNRKSNKKRYTKKVIHVNLKKVLDKEKYYGQVPILQPGDVIRVGRNAWFTWQAVIRVVSQLAIVAQVWYWYNRVD